MPINHSPPKGGLKAIDIRAISPKLQIPQQQQQTQKESLNNVQKHTAPMQIAPIPTAPMQKLQNPQSAEIPAPSNLGQTTSILSSESNADEWTVIKNTKRPRDSPQKLKTAKQTKLNYWLSNSNQFDVLSVDENESEIPNISKTEKFPKPPPIFVDKVDNIHPLLALLDESTPNNYEVKVISSNRIKIQPKNAQSFTEIVKQLESKNTEFHTYKPKSERSFKVILRNMHPSVDPEEIKSELKELGHTATNVWNMKHSQTKKAVPMFVVELVQNSNNKEIYKIKSLLHSRISFEPPHPKRELPQCSRCQQYGHTKSGCRRQPKCIKCAGNHASSDCERKSRSKDVKCALCEGNHPANYKGCAVYKKLQSSSFPALRKKVLLPQMETSPQIVQPLRQPQHQLQQSQYPQQPTYAQVTSNHPNPTFTSHEPNPPSNNNSQQSDALIVEMREMMKFLKEMMGQMSAMTNLLVNLLSQKTLCP